VIAWALLAAGCSGDDGTDKSPPTRETATVATGDTGLEDTSTALVCEPDVHIGTGEQAYAPIDDELTIVSGPQGGWHVLGAARICDLGPTATVQFEATRLSDGLIVGRSGPVTKPLIPLDSCCYGVSDVFTYLNIDGEARPDLVLEGELVRFEVVVTLPDTSTRSDSVDTVLSAGL
jgi:hypothetical protein